MTRAAPAVAPYPFTTHEPTAGMMDWEDVKVQLIDGKWKAVPDRTAPFTSRSGVYEPSDPTRANGTVIVEWMNVTGGLAIPALWMPTHRHLAQLFQHLVELVAARRERVGDLGRDGGLVVAPHQACSFERAKPLCRPNKSCNVSV